MTPAEHPVGALFSRMILRDRKRIMEELNTEAAVRVLHYLLRQIEQFRLLGKEWAMQFPDIDALEAIDAQFTKELLERCSPQQRVSGLSPEDRLEGLSPDDANKLLKLLQERVKTGNGH